jgi:hypothetical protein
MSRVPGAAARPVSVRPTTSPNAEGVPGESAAAPVHPSKTEVNRVRGHGLGEAIQTSASVLDITHTTRTHEGDRHVLG